MTSPSTTPTSTPTSTPTPPGSAGTVRATGTTRPGGAMPRPEAPARFRDLVAAEWIKLWSLRSTWWLMGLGTLAVIGLNVQATLARYRLLPDWSAEAKAHTNWLNDAFGQTPYLLLMLAAGTIGALMVSGEHTTGLIRTTFTAVPARRSVVLAKAAVVAGTMTAAGLVIALTSFGVTQAILSGRDAGFSLGDPGVPTGLAASVLVVPVVALVGLGIGAVIRHTATAVMGVFAVVVLLPELSKGTSFEWVVHVHKALPWPAWGALQDAPIRAELPSDLTPWPLAGSWLVLAAWPLVATAVAATVVHRREV